MPVDGTEAAAGQIGSEAHRHRRQTIAGVKIGSAGFYDNPSRLPDQ